VIEKLREIGVDYIQGWGVGRPTPLTTLSGELDMIEK
jgi:EAL domain-containing protein (putative c-di-GMP-specific phosphodiesterase class I)